MKEILRLAESVCPNKAKSTLFKVSGVYAENSDRSIDRETDIDPLAYTLRIGLQVADLLGTQSGQA
jgi:hypothetical protein